MIKRGFDHKITTYFDAGNKLNHPRIASYENEAPPEFVGISIG